MRHIVGKVFSGYGLVSPKMIFHISGIIAIKVVQVVYQCGRGLEILDMNVGFGRGHSSDIIRMWSEYDLIGGLKLGWPKNDLTKIFDKLSIKEVL